MAGEKVGVLFRGTSQPNGEPQEHHQQHVIEPLKQKGYIPTVLYYNNGKDRSGKDRSMDDLAAQLNDVAAILAGDTEAAYAARRNTPEDIPIVVVITGDLERATGGKKPNQPGGRVTGAVHKEDPDPGVVRLSILDTLFGLNNRPFGSVAVVWNQNNTGPQGAFVKVQQAAAAHTPPVHVEQVPVQDDNGFANLCKRIEDAKVDAVMVIDDPVVMAHDDEILACTLARPTLYDTPMSVTKRGGLVSWGDDIVHELSDAVERVDDIIQKKRRPGNLPEVRIHERTQIIINRSAAMNLDFPRFPPATSAGTASTERPWPFASIKWQPVP